MTILIKKILLLILPIFTIVITLELLARTIPTSYSIKDNFLKIKHDKIKTLILGSSQSNFGINPQYIGNDAFNIANTSQDLYYDYSVLQKYLPICKNVKLVIIPIGYHTLFSSGLASGQEAWRSNYYSYYLDIPKPKNMKFELSQLSGLALWEGPSKIISSVGKKSSLKINEYGYQEPDVMSDDIRKIINDENGKKRVLSHHEIMNIKSLSSNVSIIDKIAQECIKNNIKFIFIVPPVYKTYSDNISKLYYAQIIDTINNLTQKYSANSYNYFYDYRLQIDDYWDNDHLNGDGAKKFSIILKNEVIEKISSGTGNRTQ